MKRFVLLFALLVALGSTNAAAATPYGAVLEGWNLVTGDGQDLAHIHTIDPQITSVWAWNGSEWQPYDGPTLEAGQAYWIRSR